MKYTMEQFTDFFRAINQFDKLLNSRFEILKPGEVDYSLTIGEQHIGGFETSHGGVISGFMDAILGLGALSYAITQDMFSSTVEFKINFITPAKLGETLKGKSHIDYKGKSLVVTSADIIEEKTGRLVAKATGTFNLYPPEKKLADKNLTGENLKNL